mgnify:FL=1
MTALMFRVDGPGASFGSYLYDVPCHVCGAAAGVPCRRDNDGRVFYVHADRGNDPEPVDGQS